MFDPHGISLHLILICAPSSAVETNEQRCWDQCLMTPRDQLERK